jgi:heptaprenyl diphosphate synthase
MNKEKFMQSDVALYGMLASVALVMGYIESLIPIPYPVYGMKIGLANIVIVWVLYSINIKAAGTISLVRILLAGFLFGNLYSIIFSLAGAGLSLAIMWLLKKTEKFTIVGVSIAGGVCHNLGQIIVAVIVLENIRIVSIFPFLMVSGVVSGIAIGLLGGLLFKKIKILQTNVRV